MNAAGRPAQRLQAGADDRRQGRGVVGLADKLFVSGLSAGAGFARRSIPGDHVNRLGAVITKPFPMIAPTAKVAEMLDLPEA